MKSPPPRHPLITCVGEPLVVLTAEPGPLEESTTFTRGAGGAELNVATTLAGMGVPSAMITRVGGDGFGRYLLAHLRNAGVDSTGVIVDATHNTGLYVKQQGGGTTHPNDLPLMASRMLYYRNHSAASTLSVRDLHAPNVRRILDRTQVFHVTGITPALSDPVHEVVRLLAQRPALSSFDVNYRPVLWKSRHQAADTLAACARSSDIMFVGADEADAAFGLSTPHQIRAAFPEPEYIVVKNDAHHVTSYHGNDYLEVPALDVDVVEKIGAGDAFAAGFLAGIIGGEAMGRAVRMGHVCAATTLSSTADAASPHPQVVSRYLEMDDHHWRTSNFEIHPLTRK